MNLDGLILKNNWEPMKKLCTVRKDGAILVPDAEILTISWTDTNKWGVAECHTFLQHFIEASSRKIVIDDGIDI